MKNVWASYVPPSLPPSISTEAPPLARLLPLSSQVTTAFFMVSVWSLQSQWPSLEDTWQEVKLICVHLYAVNCTVYTCVGEVCICKSVCVYRQTNLPSSFTSSFHLHPTYSAASEKKHNMKQTTMTGNKVLTMKIADSRELHSFICLFYFYCDNAPYRGHFLKRT